MGEIFKSLPVHGFGVLYDETKNPWFETIVVENLHKLQTVELGRTLIEDIGKATPAARGTFPRDINVICKPSHFSFTQIGKKVLTEYDSAGKQRPTGIKDSAHPLHNFEGCRFYKGSGGSFNDAIDKMAMSNKTGSVCYMYFTGAELMTGKGERALPFIVLAHELIHSWHCLEGIRKEVGEEEWTTGIGEYADNPMSEQKFRAAFKMDDRGKY
jgi:hypothetical protein